MIRIAARALSIMLTTTLLQGCELRVNTDHPIGVSTGNHTDLRLIGVWTFLDEGGENASKAARTHDLVFIQQEPSGKMWARIVRWQ